MKAMPGDELTSDEEFDAWVTAMDNKFNRTHSINVLSASDIANAISSKLCVEDEQVYDDSVRRWIGAAGLNLCAPVVSAGSGYTPGAVLRSVRAHSRMGLNDAGTAAGGGAQSVAPQRGVYREAGRCRVRQRAGAALSDG